MAYDSTALQEYINREAPDIEARKLGLIDTAKALTEKGYTLPDHVLASLTPEQQSAFTKASQGIGAYEPFITQAGADIAAGQAALQSGVTGLGGITGAPTQAQLDAYMNPFQQSVIDATMSELNKQGAQAQSQLSSQAQQAGAFGGSRFGVQQAELGGNLQDARAQALSQLNLQNYGQAQAGVQNQMERQRLAAMGIGQLGLGMGQLGGQYAGLGAQKQALAAQDVQNLLGIGGMKQQYAQQQADIARQNQLQGIMQPYQQLAFYGDVMQGAPSSSAVFNTAQQYGGPSPWQAGIGTGIGAIAGIGGLRKLGVI